MADAHVSHPLLSQIIVGNKADVNPGLRQVTDERAKVRKAPLLPISPTACSLHRNIYNTSIHIHIQALAQELGLRHLEVSAKSGINVHETFAYLANDLFRLKRALREAGRHMSNESSNGGRSSSSSSSIIRLSSFRNGNDGSRRGANGFEDFFNRCCQF